MPANTRMAATSAPGVLEPWRGQDALSSWRVVRIGQVRRAAAVTVVALATVGLPRAPRALGEFVRPRPRSEEGPAPGSATSSGIGPESAKSPRFLRTRTHWADWDRRERPGHRPSAANLLVTKVPLHVEADLEDVAVDDLVLLALQADLAELFG